MQFLGLPPGYSPLQSRAAAGDSGLSCCLQKQAAGTRLGWAGQGKGVGLSTWQGATQPHMEAWPANARLRVLQEAQSFE